MINVITSSRFRLDKKLIKLKANNFLVEKGYSDSAVMNIVFIGRNKMRKIAAKYKKEDVALPVLSFSYQDKHLKKNPDNLLGEIFICYPQAVLLAAERNKKVQAILLYLIKHGIENIINK